MKTLLISISAVVMATAAPVPQAPQLAKSYGVASIKVGATTSLQFVVTNPNNASQFLTGVSFTDTLPAGLQIVSVDYNFGCAVPTINHTATTLSVSNATIGYIGYIGGNTCNIGITVQGTAAGSQHNVTSMVTSNEAAAGSAASADVNVIGPPTFSKAFNTKYLSLGQTTPLQFTIMNPNSVPLTGVSFTDTLPAGLKGVSVDYSFGCGTGLISITASSVSLSNGTVDVTGSGGGNQCVIGITVQATAVGPQNNVTSTVTSNEADPGNVATAGVIVVGGADAPFRIGYAANLNIGDSVVNISNDGFNGGVVGATPATLGNICVNTYVFDPQEEEIGCCSCLVTPNGLNSLSVKSDLVSNNLTPAVPTSIVIKLVSSTPGTDQAGAFTLCNPATVGTRGAVQVTPGLLVWGSTLEPNSTPGTYNAVSVPFLSGSLSDGSLATPPTAGSEIAGLTQLCNFIQANGSGFGICKSCRLGALGGAKQ